MAYDQSCWDLAESFLQDGRRCLPADIDALAQAIQDVCEAHCQAIEDQERAAKEKFDRNFADLDVPTDFELFGGARII